MNLRELKPIRNRSNVNIKKQVRVSFPEIKNKKGQLMGYTMIVYIGREIAEQIGIHATDKVKFFVEDENPRILVIKKSNDDVGYKVLSIKKPSGKVLDSLRVQMTWKEFKPNENEIALQAVTHDLYDGGIRIFLNK